MIGITKSWDNILSEEYSKNYYTQIWSTLNEEYNNFTIYPKQSDIFNALKITSYEDVKVIILGQDPYHGKGQAHGLSFSVQEGVKVPPSLNNIYKEISNEYGFDMPTDYGCLDAWAKQGVLLLNTTLTVRQGQANSHENIGWQTFTDKIIEKINDKQTPCVFLLWGANAIKKQKLITNKIHLVLTAPHPSPLSAYRGFIGCNHFKLANTFLEKNNLQPINWKINNNLTLFDLC